MPEENLLLYCFHKFFIFLLQDIKTLQKLPKQIPIFPLQGVVMFPNTYLPLNIFEPRYLKMIDEALATESRLIGMIQPMVVKDKLDASFHKVGCAGKIIKFEDIVYNKRKIILELIDFFEKNYQIKINNKSKKVENIIKYTKFEEFKNEELMNGCKESNKKINFFSVGEKNQWKNKLTKEQIFKIEEKFNGVMKKFNYKLVNNL